MILLYSLLAALAVASISLLGIFLFRNNTHITGTHRFIIPVALGMFLGIVFFELIPETLHKNESLGSFAIVGGFLAFYLLSHVLRTYHHHHHGDEHCEDCPEKNSATMLLVGDSVHNLADGVVIVSAFLINPAVGIAATIGIMLHEIPQEIAEFGVLVQSGYTRAQAAVFNFISASSVIVGVGLSLLFVHLGDYLWILTGIAAGNLLYIAAADMIPELHGEQHRKHFITTFLSTLAGLIVIVTLITYSHGGLDHAHEEVSPEEHADEEVH